MEEGGVPSQCGCGAAVHHECLLKLCQTRKETLCTICKAPIGNMRAEERRSRTLSPSAWSRITLSLLASLTLFAVVGEWCLYYVFREGVVLMLACVVSLLFLVVVFFLCMVWRSFGCRGWYAAETRTTIVLADPT